MANLKSPNRYSASLCLKNRETSGLFEDKSVKSTRPRSALSDRKVHISKSDHFVNRRVKSASTHRKTYKQHGNCNDDQISERSVFTEPILPESAQVTIYKPKERARSKCDSKISSRDVSRESHQCYMSHRLPSSLGPLAQLAQTDFDGTMLGHPALAGSVVVLPCLQINDIGSLPELPSSPPSDDEPYSYTHVIPAEHIHKPKKHSHPYYDRIKSIKGWVCNHTSREIRVGSINGETIHRFKVSGQRNKAEVRREIEELERLMKGLSTDWGTASVVLYQNEINSLQQMVKDTLALTNCPDTPPGTPDPTGLRKFCKEYDTALQALQHRHEECMLELNRLEEYEYILCRSNPPRKVTNN